MLSINTRRIAVQLIKKHSRLLGVMMETSTVTINADLPMKISKASAVTMTTKMDNRELTNQQKSNTSGLVRPDLADYCPASNLAFNEIIREQQKAGRTIYHFGFGQAPFPVLEGMVNALREHAGENAYLPVAGILELREVLCRFHERYDRLTGLHPDQVIVAPGTKELIFLLLSIFNGDVMVLSPSWTTYKPQIHLAGKTSYVVDCSYQNDWRVTPDDLEKAVEANGLKGNKILILCNPDNPTGTCYQADHLKALSAVCRKHNILVLCDEIYARLHFDQNHDTLSRHYPEGCILSSGMSKWASAGGWRLGYQIYPPELKALKDAVKSAASHTYSCAPAPQQYAVAKALKNEEDSERYILHTTRIMAAVADYCFRELHGIGAEVLRASAGYYIFPNFEILREPLRRRGIVTCSQMCEALLAEASVALMAGGPAFLRPDDEFTARLCFVNFDGKGALEASIRLGIDTPLNDQFVQTYAKPAYDGMQALKKWVLEQLK